MKEEVRTSIRMDKKLYDHVKASADKAERSMNKQMIVLIRMGLEASKQTPLFK